MVTLLLEVLLILSRSVIPFCDMYSSTSLCKNRDLIAKYLPTQHLPTNKQTESCFILLYGSGSNPLQLHTCLQILLQHIHTVLICTKQCRAGHNGYWPVPLSVPHLSISVAGSSSLIQAVLLSAAVALVDAELPNPCQKSPRIAGTPNRMPVQLSV